MIMDSSALRAFGTALVVFASLLSLSGCGSPVTTGLAGNYAYSIFKDPDVNLREKNYAAADYIIQRTGNYVNRYGVIKALPLENITQPGSVSDFSAVIPYQVGRRLAELGYAVDLSSVTGEFVEPPVTSGEAAYTLSGHYTHHKFNPLQLDFDKPSVDVHLEIKNAKTQRLISAFDYTILVDRDLGKMTTPKAQIMRSPPQGN